MNIVIFGSRTLGHIRKTPKPTDEERLIYESARSFIKDELIDLWKQWKDLYGPITKVISGGANGIDNLGEEISRIVSGKKAHVEKADWFKNGYKAGMIRNEVMANIAHGGIYIGLPKSRGTNDMRRRLEERKLPMLGSIMTLDDLDFMIPGIKELYLEDIARSEEKSKKMRERN